jgi:hypothetical protein
MTLAKCRREANGTPAAQPNFALSSIAQLSAISSAGRSLAIE